MVKTSSLVQAALIISASFSLVIPFRIIQFIGWCVFFIICLMFVYARILAGSIKADRPLAQMHLASKERAEIRLAIKNHSVLPAFICYYSDDAPYLYVFGNKNSGIIFLRPREIRQITYRIAAQDRGLYAAGPLRIRTSDPLGLFDVDIEIDCKLSITVRPARIRLDTRTFPGFPQGTLRTDNPVYEDITLRRSVREYISGDEQKRINWRLSAKFGMLLTNQYEKSYDAPFFVFLNLAEDDYALRTRSYHCERAVEIAAAIVEASRQKKQRCGFAAYGSGFPYIRPKANQADLILDILSVIKTESGSLPYNPEAKFRHQLPAGTMIFTVGPREVENYFARADSARDELNTDRLGIAKRACNGLR